MIDELLAEAKSKMDQAIAHTVDEFSTVRTGRANPGLPHRITVDYYGTQTPLQQIAGFAVPEARMLLVTPYDKTSRSRALTCSRAEPDSAQFMSSMAAPGGALWSAIRRASRRRV